MCGGGTGGRGRQRVEHAWLLAHHFHLLDRRTNEVHACQQFRGLRQNVIPIRKQANSRSERVDRVRLSLQYDPLLCTLKQSAQEHGPKQYAKSCELGHHVYHSFQKTTTTRLQQNRRNRESVALAAIGLLASTAPMKAQHADECAEREQRRRRLGKGQRSGVHGNRDLPRRQCRVPDRHIVD